MLIRYSLRDRQTGKFFERSRTIEAPSKTEARRMLAEAARRDIPQGRNGARNLGYVPFRDWLIVWET